MLVPGRWVLTLLVSWTQLSVQVSKAGAKVRKGRMKVPEFGQSTQIYVYFNGKSMGQKSNITSLTNGSSQAMVREHMDEAHPMQQQQQGQQNHHQYKNHHTNQLYEDVLHTDTDDGGWHNGALSLMLSVLTEKIVQDMTSTTTVEERLSVAQARSLRHRLKGLYAYLKDHPALMERRLYVGSKKPHLPIQQFQKRDFGAFTLDIEQPVCPSRAEWRQLHSAKDINDTDVQVYQPLHGDEGMQWFYTVSCANAGLAWQRDCPGCCIGINHVRYVSSCQPKKTFVMALVRKQPDHRYDWNWIQVDTSCNCAVKPLNPFDFG